jgi:MlaC protein
MGERWKVYDVVVEGSSIVNNCRSQCDCVMARSSFDELLERVKHGQLDAASRGGKQKSTEHLSVFAVLAQMPGTSRVNFR